MDSTVTGALIAAGGAAFGSTFGPVTSGIGGWLTRRRSVEQTRREAETALRVEIGLAVTELANKGAAFLTGAREHAYAAWRAAGRTGAVEFPPVSEEFQRYQDELGEAVAGLRSFRVRATALGLPRLDGRVEQIITDTLALATTARPANDLNPGGSEAEDFDDHNLDRAQRLLRAIQVQALNIVREDPTIALPRLELYPGAPRPFGD